jgi:hypothetical protein
VTFTLCYATFCSSTDAINLANCPLFSQHRTVVISLLIKKTKNKVFNNFWVEETQLRWCSLPANQSPQPWSSWRRGNSWQLAARGARRVISWQLAVRGARRVISWQLAARGARRVISWQLAAGGARRVISWQLAARGARRVISWQLAAGGARRVISWQLAARAANSRHFSGVLIDCGLEWVGNHGVTRRSSQASPCEKLGRGVVPHHPTFLFFTGYSIFWQNISVASTVSLWSPVGCHLKYINRWELIGTSLTSSNFIIYWYIC